MTMNEILRKCKSYDQYIDRIESRLIKDLIESYPNADIDENDAVWDALTAVFNTYDAKQFIFVIDEWDFIFHMDFVTVKDKSDYIDFLGYENGCVRIPNKDLMDKSNEMLIRHPELC
jgi:hypothetical protein